MNYLPRPEGPTAEDFKPSRRLIGSMFFTGYAVTALGANAEPITTSDEGLILEEVLIPNGEPMPLPAYVARPKKRGRHPTIIVVNEIWGIHAYIKDVCKRWAQQGYVVIAPAFYHRAGDPAGLTDMAQIRAIVATAKNAQVMGDVGTTLAWLTKQSFASRGRSGITGFCWGGTVIWMAAAAHPKIGAGVAFYGRLVAPTPQPDSPPPSDPGRKYPIDVVSQIHAPVLGLYGGKDRGIPVETVEQMRAALKAAGKTDCEIIVYPEAEHGFHADHRPSYNEAAAKDAWKRATAWFNHHLK